MHILPLRTLESLEFGARRAQNYMKLFVAHKMTRNNTLNKVCVAATELPQILLQKTNMFGDSIAQSHCQTVQL